MDYQSLDELRSNAGNRVSGLQEATSGLVPLAQTFVPTNSDLDKLPAQTLNIGGSTPNNAFDKFFSWVGETGKEIGGLVAGVAKDFGEGVLDTIEAPFKLGANIVHEFEINNDINNDNQQIKVNQQKFQQLQNDYKSGRITQQEYKTELVNMAKDSNALVNKANSVTKQAVQNQQDTVKNAISTAEDVIGVVSAVASDGLSLIATQGTKNVADGSADALVQFFGKKFAAPESITKAAQTIDRITTQTVNGINKVSTFNGKFSSATIAKIAQDAVDSSAASLSAGQIAKNVAINLLIKKPLIYQTNIDLAQGIYNDMLKGNLSGAALSTALTATMALSGGPVGAAFEFLGKGFQRIGELSWSGGRVTDIVKQDLEKNLKSGKAQAQLQELLSTQAGSTFAKSSFIDATSAHIGNGATSQIQLELVDRLQKGDVESYQAVKAVEQMNMLLANGDSARAAGLLADWFNSMDGGRWLRNATAADVVDSILNYYKSRILAYKSLLGVGYSDEVARRVVIGRADQSDLNMISEIVAKADDSMTNVNFDQITNDQLDELVNKRLKMFQRAIDRYGRTAAWANSDTFVKQIKNIIGTNISTADMQKAIQSINVGRMIEGLPRGIARQLARRGYIALLPDVTKTPFVKFEELTDKRIATSAVNKGTEYGEYFQKAVKPIPVLTGITSTLTRLGLSPYASQELVQTSFKNNFADYMADPSLKDSVIGKIGGDDILQNLYSYIRNRNQLPIRQGGFIAPVTDLRQLRAVEIKDALSTAGERALTDKEAKIVMSKLNSAMLHTNYQARGAGDKLLDLTSALSGGITQKFSRIQNTARFVWNPFFRWQQSYQTEMLAQFEATGKLVQVPGLNAVNRLLFPSVKPETDRTIQYLEQKGIFGDGFSGTASDVVIGHTGSRVLKSEKISLSGLVNLQAKRAGYTDVTKYVDDHLPSVVDTLQTITVTKHTNGFLDSPLTRTINTAFFPFRYNLKMASLIAKEVSKLSSPTQVAIIAGMMNAADWLNSDQGIAWQQQYSNAISLFNWLSPTYPLTYVIQLGRDISGDPTTNPSIGDLGLLGGLPFGMISQFLEANGVIQQAPYINPKTGEVYPDWVPTTARAEVNEAIQSLLGSLFTYPGAIIGLPSKTSILKDTTSWLVGGDDFATVDQSDQLNQWQQKQQQIIQQQAAANGQQSQYSAPSSGYPDTSQVQSGSVSLTREPLSPDDLVNNFQTQVQAASSGSRKKKESEYTPWSLPSLPNQSVPNS